MKLLLILILISISATHGREKPSACLIQPETPQNNAHNKPIGLKSHRNTRIAGGEIATQGQFPWHVHMVLYDDLDLKICGGALINPKWVLTSGMCIVCASSALLYFGMVDRLSFELSWMTHVTNYDHFIVHEDYEIMNFDDPFADNIGLVFLQKGGDFLLDYPNVKVIELPNNYSDMDFLDLVASTAGFGATEDPPTHSSQVLKYIDMPVISNEQCNQTYIGAISDTKICTDTTNGKSTCHGDFGAPLTTKIGEEDILIGVGSLRYFRGCQLEAPAVFTRITKYLDWIETNTSEEPSDEIDCDCECICHTCPVAEQLKVEL